MLAAAPLAAMAPNRRAVAVPLSTGAVPPAAAVAARARRRRSRGPMQAAPLRAGAAGAAVLASPLPIEGALPPLYPAALPAVTTAAVIPAIHAAPAPALGGQVGKGFFLFFIDMQVTKRSIYT